MAVPTGTVQTFTMVGIKEDLSDVISNIDPTETPFYSRIKKGKCKNRNPEWIIDTRRAANAANKAIEGNNPSNLTPTTPVRAKNYIQIFDGTIQVSDTAQAVETAGRDNEMAYQVAKEGVAIRMDIESRICGNYASVAGASGTASETAGFEAWITSNDSRGATGADGGYNTGTGLVAAATDGTQRTFTEAIFKAAIKTGWTNGAKSPLIIAGPTQKQLLSAFAGIATNFNDVKSSDKVTIVGSADVYVSDFGRHTIVPSRLSRDRTVMGVDPDFWELLFLIPFKTEMLAKTGHSEQRMVSAQCALKSKNEKANIVISDLS